MSDPVLGISHILSHTYPWQQDYWLNNITSDLQMVNQKLREINNFSGFIASVKSNVEIELNPRGLCAQELSAGKTEDAGGIWYRVFKVVEVLVDLNK